MNFQWKWYTIINTSEWNTIEPPISMDDIYIYLGKLTSVNLYLIKFGIHSF